MNWDGSSLPLASLDPRTQHLVNLALWRIIIGTRRGCDRVVGEPELGAPRTHFKGANGPTTATHRPRRTYVVQVVTAIEVGRLNVVTIHDGSPQVIELVRHAVPLYAEPRVISLTRRH